MPSYDEGVAETAVAGDYMHGQMDAVSAIDEASQAEVLHEGGFSYNATVEAQSGQANFKAGLSPFPNSDTTISAIEISAIRAEVALRSLYFWI